MDPDDREFMRELLLRHEKATNAMIAGLNENTARVRAGTEELKALTRRVDRHTDEFVDEMRAQRAALFRMLDRLDGGAAGAGA